MVLSASRLRSNIFEHATKLWRHAIPWFHYRLTLHGVQSVVVSNRSRYLNVVVRSHLIGQYGPRYPAPNNRRYACRQTVDSLDGGSHVNGSAFLRPCPMLPTGAAVHLVDLCISATGSYLKPDGKRCTYRKSDQATPFHALFVEELARATRLKEYHAVKQITHITPWSIVGQLHLKQFSENTLAATCKIDTYKLKVILLRQRRWSR